MQRLQGYLRKAKAERYDPKIYDQSPYLCYIRMVVILACQNCDLEVVELFYNFTEFEFTLFINKDSDMGLFNSLSNEIIGRIFSFSQNKNFYQTIVPYVCVNWLNLNIRENLWRSYNINMFTETGQDIGMTFVSGNLYLNILNRNTHNQNPLKILEIFKYLKNICKLHITYDYDYELKYRKYIGVLIIEQAIYIGNQELLNYILSIYNEELVLFNLQNTHPIKFDKTKSIIDLSSFDLDNIISYLYY